MEEGIEMRLLRTFVVGGLIGLFSQVLVVLWRGVLGADSMWLMPAMLATLGVISAVLYLLGVYQRIEHVGCMGAAMPFSGLVSAVASAFLEGYEQGGASGGVAAGFKLFLYVLGIGSCLAALVGVVAALAL